MVFPRVLLRAQARLTDTGLQWFIPYRALSQGDVSLQVTTHGGSIHSQIVVDLTRLSDLDSVTPQAGANLTQDARLPRNRPRRGPVEVVTEAGGRFTDLEGRKPGLDTRSVLAATPALHAALSTELNKV